MSSQGKINKEYVLWTNMLKRCYSPKYQANKPTYIGCTMSNNFKQYSYFYEWCQSQICFNLLNCQLDKDLLLKDNKQYSEETCIFIPQDLNVLIIKNKSIRGHQPIGVIKYGNNFRAQCSTHGSTKFLGTFVTPELAFSVYKAFKESHIKELAEKYKTTIDPRAYKALLNYEVCIND
jgi:hypothetical protein